MTKVLDRTLFTSGGSKKLPSLGFLLGFLSRGISTRFCRMTAPYGIRPAQFPVLKCLDKLGTSTQKELSELCGIEQPSMAVTLRKMEKEGLIVRSVDPVDARRHPVTLSKEGRAKLRHMYAVADELYAKALEGFSPEEIEAFTQMCERLINNLKE